MIQLSVKAKKNPDGSVDIFNTEGNLYCRFDKHHSNKPDYRNKYVTINCYRYLICWERN